MSNQTPRPELRTFVEGFKIKMDNHTDESRTNEAFAAYANAVATNTELRLDTLAKADVYNAQIEAILIAALVLTQMEFDFDHPSLKPESHDKKVWHAMRNLDAYGADAKLTKAQKSKMRNFIKQAHHADETMTIEEVVDLAAAEDRLVGNTAFGGRPSIIKGVRLLLERHGIEPTQPRQDALVRRAQAAVDRTVEGDEDDADAVTEAA